MPIIAATDGNTEIGDIIERANSCYKVISGDIIMNNVIAQLVKNNNIVEIGNNGWELLQSNYLVDCIYQIIINKFN